MEMINGQIIAGFPCIGKSTLSSKKNVIDLESSLFMPFKENGERDCEYYINMAMDFKKRGYIVLLSAHKEVRQLMLEKNVDYMFIKPHIKRKEEFIVNSEERQPHPLKTELLSSEWNNWLEEIEGEKVRILKNGFIKLKKE